MAFLVYNKDRGHLLENRKKLIFSKVYLKISDIDLIQKLNVIDHNKPSLTVTKHYRFLVNVTPIDTPFINVTPLSLSFRQRLSQFKTTGDER